MRNKPTAPLRVNVAPPRRRLRPGRWAVAMWFFVVWGALAIALTQAMHDTMTGPRVLIIATAVSAMFIAIFILLTTIDLRDADKIRRADEEDAQTGAWLHPKGHQIVVRFAPDSGWWQRPVPGDWLRWDNPAQLRTYMSRQELGGFTPMPDDGTRWVVRHLNRAAAM